MGVGARQLYRLSSVVVGVLGGVIARAVFLRLWTRLTSSDDKPEPDDEDAGWCRCWWPPWSRGALFAVVRAFLRRAEATGVARLTGEWPEDGA